MRLFRRNSKLISGIVVFTVTMLTAYWTPTRAALVTTQELVQQAQVSKDREKVEAFLNRIDVQEQLKGWGVDPNVAKARVDDLTDQEISQLAAQIDQLPAGGNVIGVLIGVIIVIFLVLLLTDLLGITDVYPFIKKR